MHYLFKSPPYLIGRHEWRVTVIVHSKFGITHDYEFRAAGELPIWEHCSRWPGYDPDNTRTAGLPESLRRLYEMNLPEIERAKFDAAMTIETPYREITATH